MRPDFLAPTPTRQEALDQQPATRLFSRYPARRAVPEEALAETRARGDGHGIAFALRGLARLRRADGEGDQAPALLRESLTLLGAARGCPLLPDVPRRPTLRN